MGPNSLMVVYVEPLGKPLDSRDHGFKQQIDIYTQVCPTQIVQVGFRV